MKRGAGGESGNEPVFQFRWKDNGKDWSTWRTKSLGKLGEDQITVEFSRLGMYKTRQYEIVHSGNSDFILVDAEEDVDLMRS